MRAIACVLLLAACYSPRVATGVPCGEDGACPRGQECDTTQEPPRCGSPVDPTQDAGIDAFVISCGGGVSCPAELPVCDAATMTCRRCVADAECDSDVCHERAGTCIAESMVLYVSGASVEDNACTRSDPCPTVDDAMQNATPTRTVIKIADGVYGGFEIKQQVTLISGPDRDPAGVVIGTLSGNRGMLVQSAASVVVEGITVDGTNGVETDGDLTLERVAILRSMQDSLRIKQGTARVAECVIADGVGAGVLQSGGMLEVSRTSIVRNRSVGLELLIGATSVINSIIADNGNSSTGSGGVRIVTMTPIVFRFNTVANNIAGTARGVGVSCTTSSQLLESSIFAFNGPAGGGNSQVDSCSTNYSLFTSSIPLGGTGNVMGDPLFTSSTDLHITAGSPAVDAADPASGEAVDIDGEARPKGAAHDIGADEIP